MEDLDAENASEPKPEKPEQPQRSRIHWRQWIALVTDAAGMRRTDWRRWIAPVSGAVIAVLLLGSLLNGFATYITHSSEQRDKAALDRALAVASTQYNVPPARLQPIVDTEQRTLAAMANSFAGYQQADNELVRLTQRVNALIRSTPAQARSMTQADLTALRAGVDTLVKGHFREAAGFQQRLQKAQTRLAAAGTTPQYFAVDTFALDQLAAVNAFQPTYQHLQDFTKLIQNESLLLGGATGLQSNHLQCAQGLNESFWLDDPLVKVATPNVNAAATPELQWPASDRALLRAAATSADFTSLNDLMTAQTQQILANEAALLPRVATNLLQEFRSNIAQLKQEHQNTTTFEQLYVQDQQQAQKVAASPTLANYIAFVTTLRTHSTQIALPLIKAKTNSDLATLRHLIAQGQASKTIDPANGVGYPDAYEYADPGTGIGDATQRLALAQTTNDYQLVDNEILMFTANIQAMLKNLKDPTPWNQPHATDRQLINHYGISSARTRILVVSLREQAMRLYDSGKFVKAIQVTTGAPDLPSVPGLHCALDHLTNIVFTSPDPPGSPNYYQPTPIHYSMDYSYYGFAVHDAWWRSWFGKYSNLPHFDPAAFNGGSHGCINMSYSNGDAAYVFNFAQAGTPIIVY